MKIRTDVTIDQELLDKVRESGMNFSGTVNTLFDRYFRTHDKEVQKAFKEIMGRDMTQQETEAFAVLEKEDGRTIIEFSEFIKFKESGAKDPPVLTPKYIEALKQTDTFKLCADFWHSNIGKMALSKSRDKEQELKSPRRPAINSAEPLNEGNTNQYIKATDENKNNDISEATEMIEEKRKSF